MYKIVEKKWLTPVSYTHLDVYKRQDIYFITKKSDDLSLFYILGYINSEVFLQWFKYNGKIKGKNFEFYSTPLKETPIYYSCLLYTSDLEESKKFTTIF